MVTVDKNFSSILSGKIEDYPDGIVFIVDKPYRWTSADVIRKIKFAACRHFGKKNLKVGHAGTLDPLATGVLTVCIGNACKKAQALQDSDKQYVAGVCFGASTPSFDREKDIDRRGRTEGVNAESLKAVLPRFAGEQDQVAPLFSAKQIDGRRAYEIARAMLKEGKPLDEKAREVISVSRIRITGLELLDFGSTPLCAEDSAQEEGASSRINIAPVPGGLPLATLRVDCSKGTYIRALARDLGEAMGSCAFLYSLKRTASGGFRSDDALDVEAALSVLRSERDSRL